MNLNPRKYSPHLPPSRLGWKYTEWRALHVSAALDRDTVIRAIVREGFPVIAMPRGSTRRNRAKYGQLIFVGIDVYEDKWLGTVCRTHGMPSDNRFISWGIVKEPAPLTTKEVELIIKEIGPENVLWPTRPPPSLINTASAG